jgi:hypothetical protein
MRCENDFFENSEKECELEATLDSRLVSHPENALSLDRIPGDSLRIVARPLDSVLPDYAGTLQPPQTSHRQMRPEGNQGKTAC